MRTILVLYLRPFVPLRDWCARITIRSFARTDGKAIDAEPSPRLETWERATCTGTRRTAKRRCTWFGTHFVHGYAAIAVIGND